MDMSYSELPDDNSKISFEINEWERRVMLSSIALVSVSICVCIAGFQGLFGAVGSGCPAYGSTYTKKFIGGGGEGYLREILGELGIMFFLVVDSIGKFVDGQKMAGIIRTLCALVVITSQAMDHRLLSAAGLGVLILLVILEVLVSPVLNASRGVFILKRVTIVGGLVVLFARQIVGPTSESPFWLAMLGRCLIVLGFLEVAALGGLSSFIASASLRGFPVPSCIGLLAYLISTVGPIMSLVGAVISSFTCDAYFLEIRLAQWIAIPGAELLLMLLMVWTLSEHVMPLLACTTAGKWKHWQDIIENSAIIGSLTYLTGSDVWSL